VLRLPGAEKLKTWARLSVTAAQFNPDRKTTLEAGGGSRSLAGLFRIGTESSNRVDLM
jgi:hypothetical protein